MYQIKKFFIFLILFIWVAQPCFATTSHSKIKHKRIQAHQHKVPKKIITRKKIHYKKIVHKKPLKAHKIHRIMKPHIVKKREIIQPSPAINTPVTLTSSPTPMRTSNFYRVLTQPMTSARAPSAFSPSPHRSSFATHIQQRLVDFVHKSVASLRYSVYKLGGNHIDTSQGIYIVDCSRYVDYTLRSVFPNAYFSLVDSSGAEKPNTSHYYHFFTNLSNDPDQYWSKIEEIEQLRPGDILVFRYKNIRGQFTGGHVMVVMNKPVQDGDAYLVSVADSAASGHSEDTRQHHVSGVGIGKILLKIDPKTKRPAAYAWTVNSRWKNNVKFAMARPLGKNTWNS